MRLGTLGIVLFLVACDQTPKDRYQPDRIAPSFEPNASIESSIAILAAHRAATGTGLYDEPIEMLVQQLCADERARDRLLSLLRTADKAQLSRVAMVTCERFIYGEILDTDPGTAALLVARSRKETRNIANKIACALCAEQNEQCVCDGRECEPEDYSTDLPMIDEKLVCGRLVIDGRSYRWGASVRHIRNRP